MTSEAPWVSAATTLHATIRTKWENNGSTSHGQSVIWEKCYTNNALQHQHQNLDAQIRYDTYHYGHDTTLILYSQQQTLVDMELKIPFQSTPLRITIQHL